MQKHSPGWCAAAWMPQGANFEWWIPERLKIGSRGVFTSLLYRRRKPGGFKGSRKLWLYNPENFSEEQISDFSDQSPC